MLTGSDWLWFIKWDDHGLQRMIYHRPIIWYLQIEAKLLLMRTWDRSPPAHPDDLTKSYSISGSATFKLTQKLQLLSQKEFWIFPEKTATVFSCYSFARDVEMNRRLQHTHLQQNNHCDNAHAHTPTGLRRREGKEPLLWKSGLLSSSGSTSSGGKNFSSLFF